MSKHDNTFVWYDLNTTDKAGAKAFYGALFGWSIEDREMEAGTHTSLAHNSQGFGGIDEVRGDTPPHWLGYFAVSDLDDRVKALGGIGAQTMMPGFDIPGVGRIAVLSDPAGAAFALYQASSSGDGDWEPNRSGAGDIGWAEVAATDVAQSKSFYGKGFGWSSESKPMPTGEYVILSSGDTPVGGLYAKPEMMPVCAWTFYVNVDDLQVSVAKATSLGATVLMSETVPGMVAFALISDPQGAVIGIAQSLEAQSA